MLKKLVSLFKFSGKFEKNLPKINLLFIFIFLNIWDFVISREVLNGMVLGILMFGPAAFLWFIGTVRAVAVVTLISIFEFTVMAVFVAESFQLSGAETTAKSIFWLPYLIMASVNGFWGLKIYSAWREKRQKI